MEKASCIYVAGHRGLVGSAIVAGLTQQGYSNLVVRTRAQLDLTDREQVDLFFKEEEPEYVILAAAKVGGIQANESQPAAFIYENLQIQNHVIDASHRHGVKRLLFIGSSCIYPKLSPQPIKEEYLLTGALEPSNRPYALAKIAGIEMCWSYNRQYGTRSLAVIPSNLYGPGDSFDPSRSHVLPALIRKVHEAKQARSKYVVVWGTGKPRRELLYSEDLADACIHLLKLEDAKYNALVNSADAPIINVGTGEDVSIGELAEAVREVLQFDGQFQFDTTRTDGVQQKLLDVSRMKTLGWNARTVLKEGISKTYIAARSRLDVDSR